MRTRIVSKVQKKNSLWRQKSFPIRCREILWKKPSLDKEVICLWFSSEKDKWYLSRKRITSWRYKALVLLIHTSLMGRTNIAAYHCLKIVQSPRLCHGGQRQLKRQHCQICQMSPKKTDCIHYDDHSWKCTFRSKTILPNNVQHRHPS